MAKIVSLTPVEDTSSVNLIPIEESVLDTIAEKVSPSLSAIGQGFAADAQAQGEAGRVALTMLSNLAAAPVAGVGAGAQLIGDAGLNLLSLIKGKKTIPAEESLKAAQEILNKPGEAISGALLKTPQEQILAEKTGEAIGFIPNLAGRGLMGLAELPVTGHQGATDVIEGRSPGSSFGVPIAGAIGEISAWFGLPGIPKSVKNLKNTAWYREMTIPERGLVVKSLDDMLATGMPEAEILRRWNNPQWREEALTRRGRGTGEGQPEQAFTPPATPEEALRTVLQKLEGREPSGKLPPGQGFTMPTETPFLPVPSTAIQMPFEPLSSPVDPGAILLAKLAEREGPNRRMLPMPEGLGEGFTVRPAEAEAPIVTKSGAPFKSAETAAKAGKGLDWKLYEIVAVEGGFAIARKPGREIRPADAPKIELGKTPVTLTPIEPATLAKQAAGETLPEAKVGTAGEEIVQPGARKAVPEPPSARSDYVMSEGLKRLHDHQARVRGLNVSPDSAVLSYLKQLEEAVSGKIPERAELVERAIEEFHRRNFAKATELSEAALGYLHMDEISTLASDYVERVIPVPPAEIVQPGAKEPWEMTAGEYATERQQAYSKKMGRPVSANVVDDVGTDAVIRHKAIVERALSEGLSVPPSVLKDYPDLAKAKPKPAARGPENLVTYLQRSGFVRLDEYADRTGDAWSRAHGIRSKDRSREMGDVAAVSRKDGKLSLDEAAANLNSEGWGPQAPNGREWTPNDLFNVLSEKGKGRNIFAPEKMNDIIERKIRREENAWIEKQLAEIEARFPGEDPVDAGDIQDGLIDEIKAQGTVHSEEAALKELDDFFSEVSGQKPAPTPTETPAKPTPKGEFNTADLEGMSAAETFDLTNPETEMGTLKPKDRGPRTAGMFEEQPAQAARLETGGPIQDFGEKIGGARKDTAESGYTVTGKAKTEEGPEPWRKKYVAMEKIDGTGWTLGKTGDRYGLSARASQKFATKEEAEKAIPLLAVAEKHSAIPNSDGTYSIFKRVTDRKRIKVVNRDFPSREEAMKYMAEHAEEILNIKTSFGEEILPVPEIAVRKGVERRTKDATSEMFMETFAPRGIEFGNWNNQAERQQVMNHAYDGLLDLADAIGVPPKALMLNGELAIAFGARGQGLIGAKAHYERDYGIINLTKMKGAGSLAHEWMHALDHYLGRLDTKAKAERVPNERGDLVYPAKTPSQDYLSHGTSYKTQLRAELRAAHKDLIESMYRKAEQFVEDTKQADKFLAKAREQLQEELTRVRHDLERDLTSYHKSKGGYSGKPIRFFEPASAEQLAEFVRLANVLVEGGDLQVSFRYNQPGKQEAARPKGMTQSAYGRIMAGRHSNDTLDSINAILKAVRNHQGFNSQGTGSLDRVRAAMGIYSTRLKMFEDAQAGTEKTKKVPTSYAIEARKMDQARTGDYWSEPHEMVARAFASYVEDMIAQKGGQSDFLVYHAHGGIFLPMLDGFIARPYPEGAERAALNKAFDKFVKTLKTKQTDKGTMLYSAGKNAADVSLQVSEAIDRVKELAKKLNVSIASIDYIPEKKYLAIDIHSPEGVALLKDHGFTEEEIIDAEQEEFRVWGEHRISRGEGGQVRSHIKVFLGAGIKDVYHEFAHALRKQGGLPGWRGSDEAIARYIGKAFESGKEVDITELATPRILLPSEKKSYSIGSERGSIPLAPESEILKAIQATQGKISKALPHLEDLGQRVYESGKKTFGEWRASMKEMLGDLWNRFKEHMMGIWQRVKSGKIGVLRNQKGAVGRDIRDIVDGVKRTADEYLGSISTRLGNIDPSLRNTLRKFEYNRGKNAIEATKTVLPLLKKIRTMTAEDQAKFDMARKNGDPDVLKRLVMKYKMGPEYHEYRKLMDRLHQEALDVGYDVGYKPHYHPRMLKDSKGFLEFFYKQKDWPILEQAIRQKEVELQRYLSEDEKAQVINTLLRGYNISGISLSKPGQLKMRQIETITPELDQFYLKSDAALLRYINEVTDAIEARKLFGRKGKANKDESLEDTIGGYVLRLLEEGKIKPQDEQPLRNILSARFNEGGTRGIFSLYKNLSYIDTMGSPISALTQIGDLAWALYQNGLWRTAAAAGKAVARTSGFKKEDVGIERIAQEFADEGKTSKAVSKVFRVIGLEGIDNIGKESLINSTYARRVALAKTEKGRAQLRKELSPVFEGETNALIEDLKTGKITENVKLMLFNNLTDWQPVALSEMPEKYLSGGNGRIFYMLKTFTLKMFDAFRREAFQKIKTPGKRAEGIKNLLKLSACFIVANATADEIKDFVLGRKTSFSDRVVDNLLRLAGVSKFVTWQARREGVGSAMVRQIAPPFSAADKLTKDIATAGDQKGLEITQSIPVVGKLYYWWFGKGAKKTEKAEAKASKAKLNAYMGKTKRSGAYE